MSIIETTLAELGLSKREIDVYLALVKLGSAPASSVSRRTGMVKSTTLYTCQQLRKKGIVSMSEQNETFIYTPEPPEKLLLLLERRHREIEKLENKVQQIVGPLKDMMSPHSVLPKVQFYEGEKGMIDLYESILDMRKPIDSFEESGHVFNMFPEYADEFPRKRVERKIPNRCIAPEGSPMNVSDPKKLLEVRYMDPKKYPFTWQIRLCDDLVAIFSFEQKAPVGIGIRHPDIAKNFHMLFEYVWDSLGKKS